MNSSTTGKFLIIGSSFSNKMVRLYGIERTNSPLKPAEHSTILNTDNIELTDVVDQIMSLMENLA